MCEDELTLELGGVIPHSGTELGQCHGAVFSMTACCLPQVAHLDGEGCFMTCNIYILLFCTYFSCSVYLSLGDCLGGLVVKASDLLESGRSQVRIPFATGFFRGQVIPVT